jgi:hypothetical protein
MAQPWKVQRDRLGADLGRFAKRKIRYPAVTGLGGQDHVSHLAQLGRGPALVLDPQAQIGQAVKRAHGGQTNRELVAAHPLFRRARQVAAILLHLAQQRLDLAVAGNLACRGRLAVINEVATHTRQHTGVPSRNRRGMGSLASRARHPESARGGEERGSEVGKSRDRFITNAKVGAL